MPSKTLKKILYGWKDTSRFKSSSAQAIGDRRDLIESRLGHCTAEDVVDDARQRSSPFHGALKFDVSDNALAHEHRLDLARRVLDEVMVVVIKSGNEVLVEKAFVHIVDTGGQPGYKRLIDIRLSKPLNLQAVRKALIRARGHLEPYKRDRLVAPAYAAVVAQLEEVED